MVVRSFIYSVAILTVLLNLSGTPSSELKKQEYPIPQKNSCRSAILFDLGDVLITTNYLTAFSQLHIPDVLYYMTISRTLPHHVKKRLQKKLYSIINTIEPINPHHPPTLDARGFVMPELLHQWLAGIQTPCAIKTRLLAEINVHPEWFECDVEKRIVQRMIIMLFTPEYFAKTSTLMNGAVEFVHECKQKGYEVYALSNWDAESIHHIAAQYPELFTLFDGICISGEEKCTKPDTRMYTRFLEKYDLKAEDCWFVDDQQHNVDAAFSCGIASIICPQKGLISKCTDFDALRNHLDTFKSYA